MQFTGEWAVKQEIEAFWAMGHELISATHGTTLEITKEGHLTKGGNCIVAISSEKGARRRSISPTIQCWIET